MSLKVGSRVEVLGKNSLGNVAYIGKTDFSTGKWVGVILDEPNGKNNGTVQGKQYFECDDCHGTFVKENQIVLIEEDGTRIDLSKSSDDGRRFSLTSSQTRLSSSRQSLSTKASTPTVSRENLNVPSSAPHRVANKRSSYVDPTPKKSDKEKLSSHRMSTSTPTMKIVKSRIPTTKLAVPNAPTDSTAKPAAGSVSKDAMEMENLKAQLNDLQEKLDTMKTRYKEKSHERDTLQLKLDQEAEFKIKIMEAQASLKKELEKVKSEKENALQAQEEMSDIAETLEMMTLDKEMAEEKIESLQTELAEAKEKIEELSLDLQLLKEEYEKAGSSSLEGDEGRATTYEMKQLEQQNVRLRDTLVRLRDLSAHEKHEMQKLSKELEDIKQQNATLVKNQEKMEARVKELEELVADLQEQVDAALGAEEMVENLGLQKLTLEDKVIELQEAVDDLEALQNINDQLQEDSRELELQLREEVEMARAATNEALREKEIILENLADREITIVKFRELVNKLQEQLMELQARLLKESSNAEAIKMSIPEMLDFKKMFAETKAQARAIDLELRRTEVEQSQLHIQYLVSFMPDTFLARGGDNDSILTIMLIRRLRAKNDILLRQLRDKFPAVELSNKCELVNSHKAEQFASRCRLSFHLHLLQAILEQFDFGLNTCHTDTLIKVGESYQEMQLQEKVLDGYIELLKTDQLDENVRTEQLEKSVNYFNSMHSLLLVSSGDTCVHQAKLLGDYTNAFIICCDNIRTDVAILLAMIRKGDKTEMTALCHHLVTVAEVVQRHLKQMKNKIANIPNAITLPIDSLNQMLAECSRNANNITRVLRDVAKTAFSQIALNDDDITVSPETFLQLYSSSCEKVFDEGMDEGPVVCLKEAMSILANDIATIAQGVQEAESYLPSSSTEEQVNAPLMLRAKQVKSELEQTKSLQAKLQAREDDIKELKMAIRNKQEEIGELVLRKDIAEKKLSNSSRDYELNVEKLQRKLDEAQQLMKRKEKEFEETLDHLQSDIETLESERSELKTKLTTYSKKVLIEGISKSIASSSPLGTSISYSPVSRSSSGADPDPFIINEIRFLKAALNRERTEKAKLEAHATIEQFNKLKPLPAFKKKSEDLVMKKLETDARKLEYNLVLDQRAKICGEGEKNSKSGNFGPTPDIFVERVNFDGAYDDYLKWKSRKAARVKILQERYFSLNNAYVKETIRRTPGGMIQADFTQFPTPELKQAMEETIPIKIAELTLPLRDKSVGKHAPIPVTITLENLNVIHEKILGMGVAPEQTVR